MVDRQDKVAVWLKKHYGSFGKKIAHSIVNLGDQQRSFCEAYLTCGNAIQAARESNLHTREPQLLLHVPKISAYINLIAAKQEFDLGRASAKELLDRVKATPVLTADDNLLPPELMQEIGDQLADDEKALLAADEDTLLGNVAGTAEVDYGIMQVPPVKMLLNETFGPEWILEQLVRVAERCLTIEPVYDKKGRPIGTFNFQATAATKALELLGKTMAMFKERVEVGSMDAMKPSEVDKRIMALTQAHPELLRLVSDDTTSSNRKH